MTEEKKGSTPGDSASKQLDALVDEFLSRLRQGEQPSLSEYTKRHPQLAQRIQALFPAMAFLEEIQSGGIENTLDSTVPDAKTIARGKELGRLGEYRILREIGRGGMGVVYEAEQETLGRHVALKVLPFHRLMDPRHLERFQREARAAAQLQHPGIVPVYGIGEQDGIHYYVMQFIPGQGLDKVLVDLKRLREVNNKYAASTSPQERTSPVASSVAQNLLSGRVEEESAGGKEGTPLKTAEPSLPRDRSGIRTEGGESSAAIPFPGGQIEPSSRSDFTYFRSVARLGTQVAEALSYAHAQGVLHRDIKPSNLLLDPSGMVWVTDFGLAKAEGSEELTQSGEIVGTLRYMAPERFRGWSDPRSDVYSLGLTLYELLILKPAFDDIDRGRLVKKITEEEPARLRRADQRIPRDLETVVMKAMAKEPGQRYRSADELVEDLQRFLAGEPVQARRSSTWERGVKWARRRPAAAALVTVSTMAVMILLVGALWYNAELRAAVNDKDREQARAEANFQKAREAVDKILTWVAEKQLADMPHMVRVRRKVLEEALRFYQGFLEEKGNEPEVRYETGRAYDRVGNIYEMLGEDEKAEDAYRESLKLLIELRKSFPAEARYRQGEARAWQGLGILFKKTGKIDQAEEAYRSTMNLMEGLVNEFPARTDFQSDLAAAYNSIGILLREKKPEEARKAFNRALKLTKKLVEKEPINPDHRENLSVFYTNIGPLLIGGGHPEEAKEGYLEAERLLNELKKEFPEESKYISILALNYNALGYLLQQTGQPEKAKEAYLQSIEHTRKLKKDFPGLPEYRNRLAGHLSDLGTLLDDLGESEDAKKAYQEAIEHQEELVEDFPKVDEYPMRLSRSYNNLGRSLMMDFLRKGSDEREKAEKAFRRALDLLESLNAQAPADPEILSDLGATHTNLGFLLMQSNKLKDAEDSFGAAMKIQMELVSRFPKVPNYKWELGGTLNNLAEVLMDKGELEDARNHLEEAIQLQKAALSSNPNNPQYRMFLGNHYWNLAKVNLRLAEHAEAARAARNFIELYPESPQMQQIAGDLLAQCVPLAGKDTVLPEAERSVSARGYAYDAACHFARSVELVGKDQNLPEDQRREMTRSYTERAMELLHVSVEKGFRDIKRLKEDPELNALRQLKEFQELLEKVGQKK